METYNELLQQYPKCRTPYQTISTNVSHLPKRTSTVTSGMLENNCFQNTLDINHSVNTQSGLPNYNTQIPDNVQPVFNNQNLRTEPQKNLMLNYNTNQRDLNFLKNYDLLINSPNLPPNFLSNNTNSNQQNIYSPMLVKPESPNFQLTPNNNFPIFKQNYTTQNIQTLQNQSISNTKLNQDLILTSTVANPNLNIGYDFLYKNLFQTNNLINRQNFNKTIRNFPKNLCQKRQKYNFVSKSTSCGGQCNVLNNRYGTFGNQLLYVETDSDYLTRKAEEHQKFQDLEEIINAYKSQRENQEFYQIKTTSQENMMQNGFETHLPTNYDQNLYQATQ